MKKVNSRAFFLQCYFLIQLLLFQFNPGNAQTTTYHDYLKGTVYESLGIESKLLGEYVKYSVYLPPEYNSTNEKYPVLYLLHGFNGNETSWVRDSHIQLLMDSLISNKIIRPFILVMPNGQNSYFINNYNNSFPYEDFFINELVPFIDSTYRTLPERNFRGTAGLSMGGYGAIILPVKHPDIFGYSVALSAALRTDETFIKVSKKKYSINFAKLYGDSLNEQQRITRHWKENSPFYLVNKQTANDLKKIQWYINCGMQDFLLPGNESFHWLLLDLNIPHEYHMCIGTHNLHYWDMEIPYGLEFFSSHLPIPDK